MADPDDHLSADESSDATAPDDGQSSDDDESSDDEGADEDNRKAERWHRTLQLVTDAVALGSALLAAYQAWRHGAG